MSISSPMALQLCLTKPIGRFLTHHHHQRISSSDTNSIPPKPHHAVCTRRLATASTTLTTVFLANQFSSDSITAHPFELRLTTPDQTPEEAYYGIKAHAQDLLEIKPLIDSQSWRDIQAAVRKSSPYLKQDLYTIIQAKPANQRPQLRTLYSHLFNNVSKLDYAARGQDADGVQECYKNIVAAIDEIFARI